MAKIKVRKDVAEEMMFKIEKSNPYPRQEGGKWGKKPFLKEYDNLGNFYTQNYLFYFFMSTFNKKKK